MQIFYDFIYLPVYIQLISLVIGALILLSVGVPMIVWTLLTVGFIFIYG